MLKNDTNVEQGDGDISPVEVEPEFEKHLADALPSIGEEAHLNENEGTAAVNVATTEITAAENKTKYPTGCSLEQFQCWQKTRPWLSVTDDGKVKCDVCAKISSLGLHTDIGQHKLSENAFATGTVVECKNSKKLLKKIDKHRDSSFHETCTKITEQKERNYIVTSTNRAQMLFEEREGENIITTEKIFRTAYECAHSQLSFSEHNRLIALQQLNGIDCGRVLHSDHSCSEIIEFVAEKMCKKIIKHIVDTKALFSIMIDESTSCSNDQSIIIYIRTLYDNEPSVYFFGLVPVTLATAAGIYDTVMKFLEKQGLSESILEQQLISFCSDGASTMMGSVSGVATLLQTRFKGIHVFHCMAHRLELAVKRAVDTVNAASHFRDVVDGIYKIYSMSPKNQREINEIASESGTYLLKVRKVFDVRWVFSSFSAVKALLRNYAALHDHFNQCSTDTSKNSKERSKYVGLLRKLRSWFFVAETAMMKDALRTLKTLSMYFQNRNATIVTATGQIAIAVEKLTAFKELNGKSLKRVLDSYKENGKFKGIELSQTNSDSANFEQLRVRFYQALADNLASRFPATKLLESAKVLDECNWPKDATARALYGDSELAYICKLMQFNSDESADLIFDFAKLKKGQQRSTSLSNLFNKLAVFPVSSADCERGFSQMNLQQSALRNRLNVTTVSSLLMISINGPPLSEWDAKSYVVAWLQAGRRGALAPKTGKKSSTKDDTVGQTKHKRLLISIN